MAADKRAVPTRTAEYFEQMKKHVDDLCGGSELSGNRKIQEAEQRTRDKIGRARRMFSELRRAPPDRWSTGKHELNDLLAEIIIDVACLRVRTCNLDVDHVQGRTATMTLASFLLP